MRIVLKLGGSVITEKDRPETVDDKALKTAASAIASADEQLLLVHGGGSFGHHHADRHGVDTERGTTETNAVVEIHDAMTTLNRIVLERLHEYDVPAVPVHPLSLASRDRKAKLNLPVRGIETLLEEGFVPVLHGDVIVHAGVGATILSGDEIIASLAESVNADRVGLCSTVPGVLDETGEVISRIDTYDTVDAIVGESDTTDVTGGMEAKIQTLLSLDVSASVFDLDGLEPFLSGGAPGTRIG